MILHGEFLGGAVKGQLTNIRGRLAGPDRNFRSRLDRTEKFRFGLGFLRPNCKTVPNFWWD